MRWQQSRCAHDFLCAILLHALLGIANLELGFACLTCWVLTYLTLTHLLQRQIVNNTAGHLASLLQLCNSAAASCSI